MKTIVLLAAVTVLASCTAAPPPVDSEAILMVMRPGDPAQLVKRLEAARDKSRGKERELFERTLTIFNALQSDPRKAAQGLDAYAQVLRDWAALFPRDVTVQRQTAWAFVGFAFTAQSFDKDPSTLRVEALERAKALVASFPNDGGSYGVLGAALAENQADTLTVAKAYKRCTELAPADESCKQALERFRASYRNPQCSGAGIQTGISFEPNGGIASADFAQVAVTDEETLRITMTPDGAKKLALLTKRLADVEGNLKIMFAGDTLLDARVGGPIPDGNVNVRTRDPKVADLAKRLCVKLESPPVPAELQ